MRKSPHNGKLFVFEGIDGTGKSTQAKILKQRLEGLGHEVVFSFEPTQGKWGQKIRQAAKTQRLSHQDELDLFILDRKQHVKEVIAPAISLGKIVILDRYYFSTMAYQGSRGLDVNSIRQQNEAFAPLANAVLLFELPIHIALKRISSRGIDVDLFETVDNLEKCQAIFDQLKSEETVYSFDATQDTHLLSHQIYQVIERLLSSSD